MDILYRSAFEIAQHIKEKKVSSREIVGPYLEDQTPLEVGIMLDECHRSFEPP